MKAKVNENCIGCGACVAITEEQVFDFNDQGQATTVIEEIPASLIEVTKTAANNCPTQAIEIESK